MGETARRWFRRTYSERERFDLALRFQSDTIEEFLKTVPVPEGADPEERARIQFQALRQAKRDTDR